MRLQDLCLKACCNQRCSINLDAATRIAALRADADAQAQLDLMAEKNAEGLLTLEERAIYEATVRSGTLIAILQAKARAVLASTLAN